MGKLWVLTRGDLLAALTRLGQDARVAAVLGREFDFDALESAERARLVEEISAKGEDAFAFVHALIPATLLEGLRTLQRRRLHRSAAIAIETLHPENLEALAHHYS